MKALVGTFNQDKALVAAFSVIVQPVVEPIEHYTALILSPDPGLLDRMLSSVAGHTRNNDNIAYFDAYLPEGNYCNKQQPITCKRGKCFSI